MLPDVEVRHDGDTVGRDGWCWWCRRWCWWCRWLVLGLSLGSGCGGGSADLEGDPVGLDGVVAEVVEPYLSD